MKTDYFKDDIENITRQSLEKISHYSKHSDWFPNPNKTALLVLDMQNYFLDENSHAYVPSAKRIVNNIIKLCELFEERNLPVIFTKHINNLQEVGLFEIWWHNLIIERSWDSRIIDELTPYVSRELVKNKYDAFSNKELKSILKFANIEDIVVTGVLTHLCCETTVRTAFSKNYRTFFPFDATADYNLEFHQASFINLSHGFTIPTTTDKIIEMLNEEKQR